MGIPPWLVRRLRILPAALLALLLGRRLFGRRRVAAAGASPAIESALYLLRDERWFSRGLCILWFRSASMNAVIGRSRYSDFLNLVEAGQIERVSLGADSVIYLTKAGISYMTDRFSDETLLPLLHSNGVKFGLAKKPAVRRIGPYLVLALPFVYLLMAGYMMYSASKPGSKGKPVGKRQDRHLDTKSTRTFGDAAGVDHAKCELLDIVSFLRDSTRYDKLGALMPKGALLVGPSG
jgi:cell division protease FtsH